MKSKIKMYCPKKEIRRDQRRRMADLLIFSLVLVLLVGGLFWYSGIPRDSGGSVNLTGEKVSGGVQGSIDRLEGDKRVVYGDASWYGYEIKLENGQVWSNEDRLVCAVRHANGVGARVDLNVPRRTFVRVTEISTGLSVICQVTDYGTDPDVFPDRVVDLSPKAFSAISPLKNGVIKGVRVEVIE